MNRMMFNSARVIDADTTLGISGAYVYLYQWTGAYYLLRGVTYTGMNGYTTTQVKNLPAGTYQIQVFGPGYSAGFVPYYDNLTFLGGYWNNVRDIYLPPISTNFDVVLSWQTQAIGADEDLYLYLPISAGISGTSMVGFSNRGSLTSATIDNLISPFARYLREGGFPNDGSPDLAPTERIRIKYNPSNPNAVYYSGDYWVGVTDYGDLSYYGAGSASVHIWKGGLLKAAIPNNCVPGGTSSNPAFWAAARINGSNVFRMTGTSDQNSPNYYPHAPGGVNCFTNPAYLPPRY
jgi:hypothetical protein